MEKKVEEKSSSFVSNLVKNLDCAICLETIQLPRRLNCNHYFCKHCLDNLLVFTKKGACTIKCPKKCPKLTTIPKDKTTNDLGTDYMINGVLDMVAEDQKKNPEKTKCDKSGCNREHVKYCGWCDLFYCSSCECLCKSGIYYVMYDRNEDLQVLCKEHAAVAKWVCVHGQVREFICIYCVKRTHRTHSYEAIDKYASLQRSKLLTELHHVQQLQQKEVNDSLDVIHPEMCGARTNLMSTVKHRRLLCLKQYIQHLECEQKKLVDAFDEHFQDYAEQMRIAFKEREVEIINRHDILLLMNLFRYYSTSVQPDIVMTLSSHDPDASFMSTTPLGETSLSYSRNNRQQNPHVNAVDDNNSDSADGDHSSPRIIYNIPVVTDLPSAAEILGECLRYAHPDIVENYYSEAAMQNILVTKDGMRELEFTLTNQMEEQIRELEFTLKNQMEERLQETKDDYCRMNQQLTKSLNSAKTSAEQLRENKKQYLLTIENLNRSLEIVKSDKENIRVELEQAKTKVSQLTRSLSSANANMGELNEEKKQNLFTIKKLNSSLEIANSDKENIRVELEQAKTKVLQLTRSLSSANANMGELNEEKKQNLFTIKKLNSSLEIAKSDKENIRVELEQAKTKVLQLTRSLSSANANMGELNEEKKQNLFTIKKLNSSLEIAKSDKENIREIAKNAERINRLELEITNIDIEQLRCDLEESKDGRFQDSVEHDLSLYRLTKSLDNARTEKASLAKSLDIAKTEKASLAKSLAIARTESASLAKSLDIARTEKERMRRQVEGIEWKEDRLGIVEPKYRELKELCRDMATVKAILIIAALSLNYFSYNTLSYIISVFIVLLFVYEVTSLSEAE